MVMFNREMNTRSCCWRRYERSVPFPWLGTLQGVIILGGLQLQESKSGGWSTQAP